MSKKLTRSDVERIASLANLQLTKNEVSLFTEQLIQILQYAEKLQTVDTSSLSSSNSKKNITSELRPDKPNLSLDRKEALSGAPDASSDGFFRVPKVIDR